VWGWGVVRPPSLGAYGKSVETIVEQRRDLPELSLARPSIDLDVGGSDFLLRGNFEDWESGLAFGPDLDRVNVRLAIDATSGGPGGHGLFSFHSRNVQPAGNGSYRAVGTFTGAQGATSTEVFIESPPGHTALIALTFTAKKQDFGDGWHDLIQNVVAFVPKGDEGPVRSAHAWLLAPNLAAA
jgi:hypothetical protein